MHNTATKMELLHDIRRFICIEMERNENRILEALANAALEAQDDFAMMIEFPSYWTNEYDLRSIKILLRGGYNSFRFNMTTKEPGLCLMDIDDGDGVRDIGAPIVTDRSIINRLSTLVKKLPVVIAPGYEYKPPPPPEKVKPQESIRYMNSAPNGNTYGGHMNHYENYANYYFCPNGGGDFGATNQYNAFLLRQTNIANNYYGGTPSVAATPSIIESSSSSSSSKYFTFPPIHDLTNIENESDEALDAQNQSDPGESSSDHVDGQVSQQPRRASQSSLTSWLTSRNNVN